MSEFGTYDRGPRPKTTNEILDYTSDWESSSSLSHVYTNEETRPLIRKLIQRAKVRFAEDPTWLDKLKAVQVMLNDTDEEEEIKAILLDALGADGDEDDMDDSPDEVEPDDDELAA